MADEINFHITFDSEKFIVELSRRLALSSADNFENVLKEMCDEILKFTNMNPEGDILDDSIIS